MRKHRRQRQRAEVRRLTRQKLHKSARSGWGVFPPAVVMVSPNWFGGAHATPLAQLRAIQRQMHGDDE